MPKINPLYLDPVVGYFMWYLNTPRGKQRRVYTEDEIIQRAMANDDFAGITSDEFHQAMAFAMRNLAAAKNVRESDEASYTKKGHMRRS